MKCKDCQYFKILQMPIKGWDLGMAECRKHNMVVDFASMRKVNTLECVEETSEDREQE